MANKKISELTTRTPSLSDLILVGDPSNGFSYKCTVTALATIIETDISDGYVTLGTTQTISGAKTFSNNLTLTSVANATTDPDKFLVLNGSNIVNYRTGSEVLSDIGGQATISLTTTGTSGAATFTSNTLNIPQYQGAITLTTTGTSGAATLVGNTLNIPNYAPDLSGYVPTSRTITINGTTQDLTANRTYNVGTVTSVAASAGTGISISGSPITSSGTITITNTAPDQVVALTAGTGISISGTYPNFTITNSSPSLGGTVTSVALSAPTGFAVTGSPITSSGTLALAFDTGYSLPTTASQTNWDSAYNNMIVSAAVTGTTTKTLTLTQQDAGTITASWTDDNTDAVTSVFGRTGAVVAIEGDYSLTQLSDVTITSPTTGQVLKYNGTIWVNDTDANTGTVTSVALSAPTGFSVSGSPITSSGTLALSFASGYSLPTNTSQSNWDTAYTNRITSLTTTGTSGAATLTSNTLNIPQYQGALTLTTTGTSGAATLVGNTLNIPQYSGGGGTVSGTTNYIAKFTSSTAVGDSRLFDDGTITFLGNGDVNATPSTGIFSGTGGTGTNIAGAELRIRGGASTGNASGGPITFYTSDAGTSGTGVNAATEKMRLDGTGSLQVIGNITANNFIPTGSGVPVNGLYLAAANSIGFATNTTPRMRIDASGNVGLGVTPSAWAAATTPALQVTTAALFNLTTGGNRTYLTSNTFFNGTNFIYLNSTSANMYLQYDGQHQWHTAASGTAGNAISFTQSMTLNASGNLGLGTTTIGSRLQVNGNAAIGYSASTAAPTNGLVVSGTAIIGGTTDNGAKLQVIGASGTGFFTAQRLDNSTNNAYQSFAFGGTVAGGVAGFVNANIFEAVPFSTGNFVISAFSNNMVFMTNNRNERMRITSGGNVGIGTTSPSTPLHVVGGTVWSSNFYEIGRFQKTSGTGVSLGYDNTAYVATIGAYSHDGTASNLAFWTYPGSGTVLERMRITSGGSIGIGTTTIGSTLQVNGNAAIGYSASTAAPTNGLAVAGNAGFGTTTPGYTAASRQVVAINGGSAAAQGSLLAFMQAGVNKGYVWSYQDNMEVWCESGSLTLGNNAAASIIIKPNNTDRLTVTSGGQVTLATGANVSAIAQTGYSLTGSNASSLLDLAGTWNTTGNPTAIKLNITNTASGASAYLMDLQVGGATQFRVTKAGAIRTAAPSGGTANDWKLGSLVTGTVCGTTNDWLEVEVGGTVYKLALALTSC